MAAFVSATQLFHCSIDPKNFVGQCSICSKPLGIDVLASTDRKIQQVFHKTCIFYRFVKGNDKENLSCLPFSFYPLLPQFKIRLSDTESNIKMTARQVAETYGFFLRKTAHEPPFCREFSSLGIQMAKLSAMQECPSEEKIDLFIKFFSHKIEQVLNSEAFVSFETAYRPKHNSLLAILLNEAKIDLDRYPSHLPRYSRVSIERKAGKIFVDADFQLVEAAISCSEIEMP